MSALLLPIAGWGLIAAVSALLFVACLTGRSFWAIVAAVPMGIGVWGVWRGLSELVQWASVI